MSGIGGVFIKNNGHPHQVALDKMRTALISRGSDGQAIYTDRSLGLIHARLTPLTSDLEQQPMIDAKGCAVAFDGQIYNATELRHSLKNTFDFKTNSDTETILALYDSYGVDFVNHLRGMYAVALYDAAKNLLLITRDPFGIKPLYITDMPSHVAFASEPKALIASGYANDTLDIHALRAVVTQNYIGGLDTPYPAIRRLQAGERIVYEHGVRTSSSLRPSISTNPPRAEDETTALLHLENTLMDCMNVHCRSDSGYGLMHAGDIGSSVMMQTLSILGEGSKNIKAYNAYFDVEGSADKRHHARFIAQSMNIDFQEIPVRRNDFISLLPQIAAYMDDPVADYNILTTWKMAAVAAQEQKIMLCDTGHQELFGGHTRYYKPWWKNWKLRPSEPSSVFSPHWSQLQNDQAKDITDDLPYNLLIQLDNAFSVNEIEGRPVFLDAAMSDFAFTLPDTLKRKGRTGNYLLEKWLSTKSPAIKSFRQRRKPEFPIAEWIVADATNLADIMVHHPLLTELLTKSDLELLPKLLPTLDGAKQCWPLVYLALWHTGKQKNAYAPDIIETLAS